jgi:hypothetical protein
MSDLVSIPVSQGEKDAGQLRPEHFERAVQALKVDGIVVLENIIDPKHVETLRERVFADIDLLLARKDRPFNWNSGNLQQNPPPFRPYLFRDVLVNDLVIQVTHAILGNGLKNSFYSGNTAIKSTDRQPVHADIGQLWPNLDVATPPYGIVINVPLVNFRPENGSTEVWPGTHLDTAISIQDGFIEIPADRLEARRAIRPPLQPSVDIGSVVIRDVRMWHAGMPNTTDTPRPMIAMIHTVAWWHGEAPLAFPLGSEDVFRHPVLHTNAVFVEEDRLDHISAPSAYSYAADAES